MKWMYASRVAVVTGVCSAASSQPVEPASALFQSVQYNGSGYDRDYDAYGDRDNQADDRDRQADRGQNESRRDRDDADREQDDRYDDRDTAYGNTDRTYRDRNNSSSQDVAEYNRGYHMGFDGRRHVCS